MPWLACATNRSESPCPTRIFDSACKVFQSCCGSIKATLQRYWQETCVVRGAVN